MLININQNIYFLEKFFAKYSPETTNLKKSEIFFKKRLTNLQYRGIIIFVVRDKTPDRTK